MNEPQMDEAALRMVVALVQMPMQATVLALVVCIMVHAERKAPWVWFLAAMMVVVSRRLVGLFASPDRFLVRSWDFGVAPTITSACLLVWSGMLCRDLLRKS